MYTTTLTLSRVWLIDPFNPTNGPIMAGSGSLGPGQPGQRVHSNSLEGEFRGYAGGRVRLVTTPLKTRTVQITLKMLSVYQQRQIESWAGLTLLLRDTYGYRQYGGFKDWRLLNVPRTYAGNVADVQIDWQAVTYLDVV